jgi:hypothetical protein
VFGPLSSRCVHCQLARRAITPARCSMCSHHGESPLLVGGAWRRALDRVSRDEGALAGVAFGRLGAYARSASIRYCLGVSPTTRTRVS